MKAIIYFREGFVKTVWSEKGVVDLSPISAVVRFLAGSATEYELGFSSNYASFLNNYITH